jgi:hypothetical protein
MSSNAVAVIAVVLVSGFAGCAATARATPSQPHAIVIQHEHAREAVATPAREPAPAPAKSTWRTKRMRAYC